MQLLLPVLLVTNILGLASACTQWQIQYKTKAASCELEAGTYRNLCYEMPPKYYSFNANNQQRLGSLITAVSYCDPCGQRAPRCYCVVTFGRLREWVSTSIPVFDDKTWQVDSGNPAGRISKKTVHC